MRVFSFGCQALQNIFRAYTEGILFAGSKDVCQNNDICHGKYFGKIIQKSFGAGVGVWLEYAPQFVVACVLCCLQCGCYLSWMVSVVINDCDAVYLALVLETSVSTAKFVEEWEFMLLNIIECGG